VDAGAAVNIARRMPLIAMRRRLVVIVVILLAGTAIASAWEALEDLDTRGEMGGL
jgi:hypothetical protein